MNRVLIDEQVKHFIHSLSPEPKRLLRRALKGLETESGDIVALTDELKGYYRLRVRGYRIIFSRPASSSILCVFADRRKEVYVRWGLLVATKYCLSDELPHPPSVKSQPPGAAEA
jgi:mRNA interferase RelE/StbE